MPFHSYSYAYDCTLAMLRKNQNFRTEFINYLQGFHIIVIPYNNDIILEAAVRRCSLKTMVLEISQNWQENTRARGSFLIKLQALQDTSSGCIWYDLSDSKEDTYRGVPLQQIWML